MRLPNIASTRKLANGTVGTTQSKFSKLTSHLTCFIRIQCFEPAMQQQYQSQPDRNLGRSHCQDKHKHNLAIRLSPSCSCHNKCKPRGIYHNLDREQHKNDIPAHQQSDQTKSE
jgi:hypothetical protein